MDSNESRLMRKLSLAITVLMLLYTFYASSPPLRYVCLKLAVRMKFKLRRIAIDAKHLTDPAWRRELADKPEIFVWPQRQPSWWNRMMQQEDVDAGIPLPPAE